MYDDETQEEELDATHVEDSRQDPLVDPMGDDQTADDSDESDESLIDKIKEILPGGDDETEEDEEL